MNPTAPLRNARIRSLLGLLLATAALAPLSATADAPRSDTGHAWQAQVVRISDGADARARAAAIPSASRRSTDRKSTRLNSSHVKTSYAVFCLKKKTGDDRL